MGVKSEETTVKERNIIIELWKSKTSIRKIGEMVRRNRNSVTINYVANVSIVMLLI